MISKKLNHVDNHCACCYRQATNSTNQIAVFRSGDQCWCVFSLLQLSVIRLAVNSSNQVAVRRSRELNVLNLFTFRVPFFVTLLFTLEMT